MGVGRLYFWLSFVAVVFLVSYFFCMFLYLRTLFCLSFLSSLFFSLIDLLVLVISFWRFCMVLLEIDMSHIILLNCTSKSLVVDIVVGMLLKLVTFSKVNWFPRLKVRPTWKQSVSILSETFHPFALAFNNI